MYTNILFTIKLIFKTNKYNLLTKGKNNKYFFYKYKQNKINKMDNYFTAITLLGLRDSNLPPFKYKTN